VVRTPLILQWQKVVPQPPAPLLRAMLLVEVLQVMRLLALLLRRVMAQVQWPPLLRQLQLQIQLPAPRHAVPLALATDAI